MPRPRGGSALPPCYAMVHPGLEEIAAEEITRDLGGDVRKTGPGYVVFRVDPIDGSLLRLRTTEDVFLLAWGSDQLSYRAQDLDKIRRWTAQNADWANLLRIHHAIRPKPKGRPSYHVVTQMLDKHGYRRTDARAALIQGLAGKLPAAWREVDEDAAVEIWLTIQGATAVCGIRLSDRTMRHRPYKLEHRPASLRPTIAAALIRLADPGPRQVVLDPMCGAGTILAEHLASPGRERGAPPAILGGDLELAAVEAAAINLRRSGQVLLACWDARRLPLASQSVDRIVSNPPFGKQLSDPAAIGPLYRAAVREMDRVLRPGGRAVLLVSDLGPLRSAAQSVGWRKQRLVRIRVLGQPAHITVWQKDR